MTATARASGAGPRWRRWLPWLALVLVLVGALAVGMGRRSGPPSEQARVGHITAEIRCPTCRGLSAAESDAPAAQAIRDKVAALVHQGQSDGQIFAYITDRYGSDITLRPPASGFDALVWALPVVGFVLAGTGLAFAFRRWHSANEAEATAEDRARVARELEGGSGMAP